MESNVARLRALFNNGETHTVPCCWDALSAKLIERAGFPIAFMSGFGVSASRLGMPDTGLISSTELIEQARNIAAAVSIPLIGDGDTGFGGPSHVKKTVASYAQAGVSCIMIEDQTSPKRCGHVHGKQVVSRGEAAMRIKAAVDARNAGADILILARTDAREEHGLQEAIDRANLFREIGADITFIEAPKSIDEMQLICDQVNGPKMANMLEGGGLTPILETGELHRMGFAIAAFPFSPLFNAIEAMTDTLALMREGKLPSSKMTFDGLQELVGFKDYLEEEQRYCV